jgi:thymidylate kinase
MMKIARVYVVGLSGPDGAGKSTALGLLLRSLADEGAESVSVYLYGCLFCRRISRPLRRTGEGGRSRLASFVLGTHALVDAFELWTRLSLAKTRARLLVARGTDTNIVLSDRSPLDGLAKHDPRGGSLVDRAFGRLARSYDLIAWLDAPPDLLAARDKEHAPSEFERQREAFTRWANLLPNVARIDASARPDAIASRIKRLAPPLSMTDYEP